jgi:hypothetical protein
LKGHTVQELAAIAGVSEEYIRMAIKIRQQQMLKEKMQSKVNATISTTTQHAIDTTSFVTERVTPTIKVYTTESTTAGFVAKKKDSSPKPYVPKKKSVAKKVYKLGQKVKDIYTQLVSSLSSSTPKMIVDDDDVCFMKFHFLFFIFYFIDQVMNAPKEYYPVGYDKNFDDNFKSKIDLPATSFNCNDQRHFPGLYGDEDLGCMVS